MIPPRKVKFEAKKKENENLRFRTFLKCNADEEELDKQFADLHKELFANFDCNRCRKAAKNILTQISRSVCKVFTVYLIQWEFVRLHLRFGND